MSSVGKYPKIVTADQLLSEMNAAQEELLGSLIGRVNLWLQKQGATLIYDSADSECRLSVPLGFAASKVPVVVRRRLEEWAREGWDKATVSEVKQECGGQRDSYSEVMLFLDLVYAKKAKSSFVDEGPHPLPGEGPQDWCLEGFRGEASEESKEGKKEGKFVCGIQSYVEAGQAERWGGPAISEDLCATLDRLRDAARRCEQNQLEAGHYKREAEGQQSGLLSELERMCEADRRHPKENTQEEAERMRRVQIQKAREWTMKQAYGPELFEPGGKEPKEAG